jgi:hypothetical protein
MSAGTVYVIRSGEHYKIGHTKNLVHRLRALQSHAPITLAVMVTIDTPHALALERFLHQALAHLRTQGEWFQLSPYDLIWIGCQRSWTPRANETLRMKQTKPWIVLEKYACERCFHQWVPRSGSYPRQCPKCGSAYWDRPRTHPQRRPHSLGPRREPRRQGRQP